MKKIITLGLVLVLVLGALAGCSGTKEKSKNETKVGFIYVGPVGDGGWTYSHDQGRLELEKELGVKTAYIENVPETKKDVENAVKDLVDQGCTIIFTTSFGFMDGTVAAAKANPDVTFMHCSGYETAKNMGNYFGAMEEARYLSGIVAGLDTKTNQIGYVAAFPIPEVVRGIDAFTLGVQSVNPEAQVNVKWTSTWYDPAKEKEAAKALIEEGSDVMAQHQDTTGPQIAAAEKGLHSIGYNTDSSKQVPESFMTAPIWNWGPYYIDVVKSVQDETWKSDSYYGNLKDGLVKLAPLTALAPKEAQAKIEEATKAIESGDLKPFSGPLYDNEGNLKVKKGETMTLEELLAIDWLVKGVNGKVEK